MLSTSVSASTRNEYTLSTSDNARDGFPRSWSYDKAWLFDGGQPVSVAMQGGQLEQGVVWGEIQGHQPVRMIWGWMDTGCRVSQGKVRNEIAFDQATLSDLWLAKKRGYKTARVDQDLQID